MLTFSPATAPTCRAPRLNRYVPAGTPMLVLVAPRLSAACNAARRLQPLGETQLRLAGLLRFSSLKVLTVNVGGSAKAGRLWPARPITIARARPHRSSPRTRRSRLTRRLKRLVTVPLLFSFGRSAARRVDALQGDDESQGQVRHHVVVGHAAPRDGERLCVHRRSRC